MRTAGLDAAEDDVVISGGGAEADWRADCAEAAIYVEGGEAVGGVGHEFDGFAHALWLVGHMQRPVAHLIALQACALWNINRPELTAH
jgi:hypothetical protein